jgi:hypothetical protein
MTEVIRGLIVDVYRCARQSREGHDPTNNGPSARLEAFTVVALTRDGEELEPLPRDLPGVYAVWVQAVTCGALTRALM